MSDKFKTYVIMFKGGDTVRIAAHRFSEKTGTLKFWRDDETIAIFLTSDTIGFYDESARVADPSPV